VRLQAFGPCDAKTSSWLLTPPDIRRRGGALFGDYRVHPSLSGTTTFLIIIGISDRVFQCLVT
jgi:Protein of unknown function (DUF4256)